MKSSRILDKSDKRNEEGSDEKFDKIEIHGKLDNYKGVVKEWQNYLQHKLNSPSTIGTKKSSIIKCQVPPKKKTENNKKIDKGGSESKYNKESTTNISPFKCKIIPKKVLDSLKVTETSAEKDQPKDLTQVNVAKVIELPKMSEDTIDLDANYFEKVKAPVLNINDPTCNYCDQKFATLSKLQNHLSEVHKVGNDSKTEIDSVLEEINEVFDKDKPVQEDKKGKNIEKQSSSFVTIKFSRNHESESSTEKSETSSENSPQKIADTSSQSQFGESFENDAKIVGCEITNVSFSKHATQITKPIGIGTEKHKSVSKSQSETRKSPRKK